MLVISRPRQEIDATDTNEDAKTASQLAAKFNTTVMSIPFLYDFPASSPVIERLRFLPEPAYFLMPLAERAAKNLLNYLRIPHVEIFATQDDVQMPDGEISGGQVEWFDGILQPRWYPIIDDANCTACMECVNYCLFGVYAIGNDSRPFVDQPDACRDGCPACARVCPSKAIMFPLYEDSAIAGYEQEVADDLNDLIDLVEQI